MFPGAGAQVYYNEAGEPLGWDYPSDPEFDPTDETSWYYDDWLDEYHSYECDCDRCYMDEEDDNDQ